MREAHAPLQPFVFLHRAGVCLLLLPHSTSTPLPSLLSTLSLSLSFSPAIALFLPPSAPDSHHLDSVVAKGMEALLVNPWVQEHGAENPLWFLPSSMKSATAHYPKLQLSFSKIYVIFLVKFSNYNIRPIPCCSVAEKWRENRYQLLSTTCSEPSSRWSSWNICEGSCSTVVSWFAHSTEWRQVDTWDSPHSPWLPPGLCQHVMQNIHVTMPTDTCKLTRVRGQAVLLCCTAPGDSVCMCMDAHMPSRWDICGNRESAAQAKLAIELHRGRPLV